MQAQKEILGKGPPCILLHGWGQNHTHMRPLAELLASHYTVHILTLPGFGIAEPPPNAWSTEQYALWVESYLKEKKITSCVIGGHSFGGKVALCYASLFPEKTKRLLLLAASGLPKQRSFKEKFLLFAKVFVYKLLVAFSLTRWQDSWRKAFSSYDYFHAKGVMREVLVKTVNDDVSEKASRLRCPTTILWGEKDKDTPVEGAHRFHKLIQGSTLYLFPSFDHQLLEGTRSHLLARYILKEVS
jgi:pimeloyl-ACP methyl ester carboxylesterase